MEAHGECMEKGNNSEDQISLLNVEGKIFFSVVARRLVSYLKAKSRYVHAESMVFWMLGK